MPFVSRDTRLIREGVQLLNRRLGKRWPFRIKMKKLNMSDSCNCVLGQLFGHYNDGKEELGILSVMPWDHGFNSSISNEAWLETIKKLGAHIQAERQRSKDNGPTVR